MSEPIEYSIYRYLDTNGDGTGTTSATGAGYTALNPGEFYIQPKIHERMELERMIVYIEDTGSFDAGTYGNGLALPIGISVSVQDSEGNVLKDLTSGLTIKQNGHWARLCYDADPQNYGIGNEYLSVRWTFSKSGEPIKLVDMQKLVVSLPDPMDDLVDHTFHVQGKYY